MHRRKIQLVAGVTYTVSLPKKWVLKNNIKDKDEVTLIEKSDGSVSISPHAQKSAKIESFDLNVDNYTEDLSQILFVLYYLGVQNINVFSKKELSNELRSKIKYSVSYMAGTEIIFEDQRHMKITVLLDKAKVNVNQIYFRTALLIKSTIDSLTNGFSFEDVTRNEEEIDRLYHLISKIILLAHTNTDILISSKIENTYFLTSYLLIAKKLENLADRLFNISEYISKNPERRNDIKKLLLQVKAHIETAMSYFMNRSNKHFTKTEDTVIKKLLSEVQKGKDMNLIVQLDDIVRYMTDIEEELTNISFYSKLIKQGML